MSKIKKVVVAHRDPNPIVAGKSIRLLRKAGIEVVEDVLKEEALFLNRIFITWITKKRPYVVLKMALSQDGKIGFSKKTKKRKVFWITGKQARKENDRYNYCNQINWPLNVFKNYVIQ